MTPDTKDITTEINQLMDANSITSDKLASLTNIPLRFINALREGELSKLPAEPYMRGYLMKIAPILKTEPEPLIQSYKDSIKEYKARAADALPGNVYAKTPVKKGWVIGVVALILMIIFVATRINDILGIPELTLNIPETSTTDKITISGNVRPGDKITLNGETVFTDELGNFERELFLTAGVNTFEFNVERFLGRQKTVVKQVYYDRPATATPPPVGTPITVPSSRI